MLSFDSNIYNASELRENFIKYEWESSDIRIERIYEIVQGEFIIRTKTKIINKSEMSKLINGSTIGYELDMSNQNNPKTRDTDKPLNEYVVFAKNSIIRKNNAYKFSEKENREANEAIEWVAFRNKYFCTIIKPRYETLGYKIKALDESHLRVSIHFPDQNIEGAGTAVFDSLIYTGPEEIRLLRKYKEGFEKIQMFYRFGLFDGIAKIIYSAMHAFYKFIPNWGIVIILISSLIYLVTYPLTIRGMLSMKKIQGIQPKIASLKEKYKNNPQKMNQEMMEIYKREKINPFGGCLPFLFQMPIFIGLYQVLWRSVSFKNAKFLWIKDLSEPDRLFVFPHSLPIIGNEFNLLPLLMAFIMFYQQKISSKNMVMTDAAQVSQQKMMMIMMPIMMGFIFYKFASGLTLYFTMFYIFSTITQYRMYKN
ncbi:MAG: membrane protein insertase YidC, partial [Candidatus Omnitrophota bacterium]|nr:membrane protein insertase YidC [Candidatus Omnitrophota bacterium]